jgi:hypothetical protein
MGQLDEQKFEAAIAACSNCDYKAFEVSAYLDRTVTVMLAQSQHDGRWIHDEAKFYDGVFRIRCLGCKTLAFDATACPRCHRANGLADALGATTRLAVPSRCPECKGAEVTLITFAPATVKAAEHQRAVPAPAALLGDAGYHVAHVACETCHWVAAAEGCPICGGPGPLRARP